jgi:hypothetical protein
MFWASLKHHTCGRLHPSLIPVLLLLLNKGFISFFIIIIIIIIIIILQYIKLQTYILGLKKGVESFRLLFLDH